MALVYNFIEIPYGSVVRKSILIPMPARLRRSYRIDYSMLGLVSKSTEVVYDTLDYLGVAQTIECPYSGRVSKSIEVPYAGEYSVLKSISIPALSTVPVATSVVVKCGIPGYTAVYLSLIHI